MKLFYPTAMILSLLTVSVMCATIPIVNIPVAEKPVIIDGVIKPQEWADAAIVRDIRVMGNDHAANPLTYVYLKYDKDSLWVGVRCFEKQAGYPKSVLRDPADLLSNDDSIQLVLGTTDENVVAKDVINYGGYAGATNQAASSADYYYQFTVNSVGSRSRFFIESPLDRPLFDSKVSKGKREWTIEMRIPFSAWGVSNPPGRSYPINVFRFRPPDMTAWYLPGFGNYAPMPFGTAVFLPADKSSERTLEPKPSVSDAPNANRVVMINGTPQYAQPMKGVSADLEWYPAAGKVIAIISAGNDVIGSKATLSISGIGEKKLSIKTAGRLRLEMSIPKSVQMPAEASLYIEDKSGKNLLSKNVEIQPQPKPDYLGTNVAKDYIDKAVPTPWKKPVVTGSTVKLYDKSLSYGSFGLLKSVKDSAAELMAGEGRVEIEYAGKTLRPVEKHVYVSMSGSRVVVKSSASLGKATLETRSIVEFDGFTILKLRVKGLGASKINRLSVVFPIKREYARLLHFWSIQQAQELRGVGYEGAAGPIWVGCEDRGLDVTFDTPVFLSSKRRSQIQVIEGKKQTLLKLNLVDGAGQIPTDGYVFRLMLQPTPTKKPSIAKTGLYGGSVNLWFEEWSDYQGYPDFAKMPEIIRRANEAHKSGNKFIVYFCQLLAENSPGFAQYKTDFKVKPDAMWYQRAYPNPGKGVKCYVCCLHGPYQDLLLNGINRLMKEGGIDGVYMDGTLVPWDCDNPSHIGCDSNFKVDWDTDTPTRITEVRNFAKRLRGMFTERGKPFVLVAHCGGALDIPVMSLADSYYEGEQLARYRPAYALPLYKFAVGYSGWPWGFRTDMIPALWAGQAAKLLPWTLLHDTQVSNTAADVEKRILGDYSDTSTTTYYPYWRMQPHVKKLSGNVLFSYYHKSDSAMLIVSNLTWTKQNASLDVSRLYKDGPRSAMDATTGDMVPISNGKISFEMESHGYKAIKLSTEVSTVTMSKKLVPEAPKMASDLPAYHFNSYDPTQWNINSGDAGVILEPGFVLDSKSTVTKITSTMYAAAATATFIPGVSSHGTVKIKLRRNARVMFGIAGATLSLDDGWLPSVRPENQGRIWQVRMSSDGSGIAKTEQVLGVTQEPAKWNANRSADVVTLSWANGKLDATYGSQPLARDLMLTGLGTTNNFKISTWAGDWMAFDVLEISDKPTRLFTDKVNHPVL